MKVSEYLILAKYVYEITVVKVTDEMCLALFPAGTIVRDPHHRDF